MKYEDTVRLHAARPRGHFDALAWQKSTVRATVRSVVAAVSVTALVVHMVGCASLDARQDISRSAAAMEQAVGASAELLLRDDHTAETATAELLRDGLTANEGVQVALLNNPHVRKAMLSIGVSRADFVQSTLYSNPSLFLSLRFPDGGGDPNVEVSLAQNIAELWLVPARKHAAQLNLDRVVLEAARTVSATVLDTRRAFIRAATAHSHVALAERGFEIATELVEMAEARKRAGSGSDVDLNLARAQQLQTQTRLRNARLTATEATADLSRHLGLMNDPQQLELLDPLDQPASWDLTAEELQAVARQERLDLKIMDQRVASAEALARLERQRFLRSIDLGFSIELAEQRSRGDRDWLAETFFDSLQSGTLTPPNLMPRDSQSQDSIAGPTISLELPLWDQNQAQIAKADRLLAHARQQREALLVEVAQDIHVGIARAHTAKENARFYREEFVPTAERSVSLAKEGYRIGSVSFLSLLEAQRSYLSTLDSHLASVRDAALVEIELERVTGRPANALCVPSEYARDPLNESTNHSPNSESSP